jgi:hypothetical protein
MLYKYFHVCPLKHPIIQDGRRISKKVYSQVVVTVIVFVFSQARIQQLLQVNASMSQGIQELQAVVNNISSYAFLENIKIGGAE